MALTMPMKTWEKGGSGNASTASSATNSFVISKNNPLYEASLRLEKKQAEENEKQAEEEKRKKYEADKEKAKYYSDNIDSFVKTYNDISAHTGNFFDEWKNQNESSYTQGLYTSLNDHYTKLRDSVLDNSYLKDVLSEDEYIRLERDVNAIGKSIEDTMAGIKSASDVYANYNSADDYDKHVRLSGMSAEKQTKAEEEANNALPEFDRLAFENSLLSTQSDTVKTPVRKPSDPISPLMQNVMGGVETPIEIPNAHDDRDKLMNAQAAFGKYVEEKEQEGKTIPSVKEEDKPKATFGENALGFAQTASTNLALGAANSISSIVNGLEQAIGDAASGGAYSDGFKVLSDYFGAMPSELRTEVLAELGTEGHPNRPARIGNVSRATGVSQSVIEQYAKSVQNENMRESVLNSGYAEKMNPTLKENTANIAFSIGQQIPGLMLSGALSGATSATSAIGSAIGANPSTVLIGMSVAGNEAFNLAREKGYNPSIYAEAVMQGGIEMMLEGLIGFSDVASYQKLMANTGSTVGNVAKSFIKYIVSGAEEGLEEVINVPLSNLTSMMFGSEKKVGFGEGDVFDYKAMIESGMTGSAVGLIMGGVMGTSMAVSAVKEGADIRYNADWLNKMAQKLPEHYRPAVINATKATEADVENYGKELIGAFNKYMADSKSGDAVLSNKDKYGEDVASVTEDNSTVQLADQAEVLAHVQAEDTEGAKEIIEQKIQHYNEMAEALADDESLKEISGEGTSEKIASNVARLTETKDMLDAGTYNADEAQKAISVQMQKKIAEGKKTTAAARQFAETVKSNLGVVQGERAIAHTVELLENDVKNGVSGASAQLKVAKKALDTIRREPSAAVRSLLGANEKTLGEAISDTATKRTVQLDYSMPEGSFASYNRGTGTVKINPVAVLRAQQQMDSGNKARSEFVHEAGHIAAQMDASFVSKVYDVYAQLRDSGIIPQFGEDGINENEIREAYRKDRSLTNYLNTATVKAGVKQLMDQGATLEQAQSGFVDAFLKEEVAMHFLSYAENHGANLFNTIVPEKRNAFVEAMRKIAQFFRDVAAKIRGKDPASAKKMDTLADKLYNAVRDFAGGSTTPQESVNTKTTENTTATESGVPEGSTGTRGGVTLPTAKEIFESLDKNGEFNGYKVTDKHYSTVDDSASFVLVKPNGEKVEGRASWNPAGNGNVVAEDAARMILKDLEDNADKTGTQEADERKSLVIGDETAVAEDGDTRYSIKSMRHDIAEGKMFDDLVRVGVFSREDADTLRDNLDRLVKYMIPFAGTVDMNEEYGQGDRPFRAYKPNSDPLYVISLDFSTLCRKRLMTQYVIEQLQLRENRPMTAEEQIAIRSMLLDYRKQNKALQVACAMCYVEAARLKAPKQMEKFFTDTESILKTYFAKKDSEFNAKVRRAQEEFKVSRGYEADTPKSGMKGKDVTALNRMSSEMRRGYEPSEEQAAIIETAKSLPRSTFLTAANLTELSVNHPEIYDAYTSHIRASTRSKSLEGDIPYYYGDSEGIVSDSFIENVNEENGFRFDSWSDFQMKHMLDMITAVIELSVLGSKMHGYTKFPEMVRIFGKTGMMFNLSGVAAGNGFDADGNLAFSDVEGMAYEDAVKLRNDFPETAGFQCIGVSHDHIRALLHSDDIDYVIPYHTSGLNATLRRMVDIYGWKDYTGVQNAKKDPNAKKPANAENWQTEPVWSEFYVSDGKDGYDSMRKTAQRYIDMCHERGLIPKFNDFTDEPNYWKLLIDRKMVNQKTGALIEQKPVRPDFDFGLIEDEVKREVSEYDPKLEQDALNYVVDNFDAIGSRIRELKKIAPKKKLQTVGNEVLQAYAEGSKVVDDERKSLATSIYIKDGHTADGQTVDFVNLILDGKKKGETRTHKSLTRKWVGIAKDGYVYGRVRFGEPYLIDKDSPEYADSYIEGTEYDIEDGEQKYYYPVLEVEDFRDAPKPITKHGNYAQYEYEDGADGDAESDSDGNALSVGQREFFKDSKVRDKDGRLKVMYHGTNTPNFTVFDPSFSDDKISLFFTDAPDVADSYTTVQSGGRNINPYRLPNTIKTAEEYNEYMESIGSDTRLIKVTDEVISKATKDIEAIVSENGRNRFYLDRIDELKSIKGKFIHYNGGVNYITRSEQVYDTAEEAIESDANDKYWTPHRFGNRYSVYLNMKNPYILDAGKHYRGTGSVSIMSGSETTTARFEVDGEEFFISKDHHESFENFVRRFMSDNDVDKFLRVFSKKREKSIREEMKLFDKTREEVLADWEKYGEMVDDFEYSEDNASIDYTESGHWKHLEFGNKVGTTRDLSKWAKENDYDGVIIENLRDIGGYSGGTVTRAATVAIAFDSNQVKSTLNENPTEDPDIRYSKDTSFTKDKYFDRQIDKWSELRENSYVKVGVIKSNSALHAVGVPTGGLYFDVSKIKKEMNSHGDHLDESIMKKIPGLLGNPITLVEFKPGTNSNTISVFGDLFVGDSPVTVGVVMTKGRGGTVISKVRTVHARRDIDNQITDDSVLYLNENKKETNAWFQACGIDVPLGGTQLGVIRSIGFVDSVPQVEKNVNTSEEDSRSSIETDQAKKIARLKEDKEFLKAQMEKSRSVALSPSDVDKIVKDMRDQFGFDNSERDNIKKMLKLIDDVVNKKIKPERMDEVWDSLARGARSILEGVYEVDASLMKENEAFIKHIRSTTLSVPEENENDFAGGYAEYRNENRKYVNLSRNGTPVETVYAAICEQYPGILDPTVTNPAYMIDEIVHAMKALEPVDAPSYADTIDQAAQEFAHVLGVKYMNTARKTHFSDTHDEIEKLKHENKQTVTAYEARLRSIESAAARDAKEYERIINRYKDIESAREFAGDRKEYARRIRQDARALRSAAVSPNSKKFVPEKYRGNVERIALWLDRVSMGGINLNSDDAKQPSFSFIRDDFHKVSEMFGEDFLGLANGLLDNMQEVTGEEGRAYNKDLKAAIFYRDAYKLGRLMRKSIADMNKVVIGGKNVNASIIGGEITDTLDSRERSQKTFESLADKKKGGKLMNIVFNKNLSFTDARSFFHRMGKAGDNIYETLREAQSRQYLYMKQYTDKVNEALSEEDLSRYAGEKQKVVSITLSNGKEYTLTAAQAMNIVTLYERSAGKSHIEKGGVRIYDPKTRQVSKATALTEKDIASLRNALDDTDKKVMRVLADFMRDECTAWGNEATMEKYGFHRFTTRDYFPISVDRTSIGADMKTYAPAQFNVENVGFAKTSKDDGSAPVLIDSMIDVANNHIRGMASYAAYLNVEDGINRILKVPGVVDAMKRALGSDAEKYITEMMNDLKGAGKTESLADNTVSYLNKLAGRYKAAAVSYNTSTVAKQPLSYLRAAAVIDPKYLVKGATGNHKTALDEMMKYSGIAVRKEIGYSDVGVGKTIGEQIGYTEKGTLKSGVRKFNEFGMAGAALADRVTWESIWLACKAEQAEKNAGAAVDRDALMKATAKRFADVVAQTQVVDSALDSAPVSRSNNPLVRLTYAFMSEPIKGYNLLVNALDDLVNSPDKNAKSRAAKHLARVSAYTLLGWAAEAAITSAFSAIRDDDDEILDKFSETYFGNLGQNALGILPMADPIVDAFLEVFQGYTPSNMADQTLIDVASGMVDAFKTIMDAEGKRETPVKAIRDAVESVATMLGVPVKNIVRMVNNTAKSAFQITNAYKASYELQKIWYNPNNATAREKNGFNSILADAYLSGDRDAYEYIYEDMRKMGLKPQQLVNSIAKDSYEDDIADKDKSSLVKYTPGSDAWYIGMKTIFNRDEKAPKATEDEITRVYKASGETSVLPKFKDGKYTVDGTSKEFEGDALDKYLEDYGNLYYEVANAMRDLAAYRKGSAEEQAWWLTKAEKFASAASIYAQDKEYSVTSVGKWASDYIGKKPYEVAKYIVGNLEKK